MKQWSVIILQYEKTSTDPKHYNIQGCSEEGFYGASAIKIFEGAQFMVL